MLPQFQPQKPRRRWVMLSSNGHVQSSTFFEPQKETDDYVWTGMAITHESAIRAALKDFHERQNDLKYERSHR